MKSQEPRRGRAWEKFFVPAEHYERELVPLLFRPWAQDLVDRADLHPGQRVLNLACGTGIVARTAARRVAPSGGVVGVDVSPQMLQVARLSSADIEPPIEWRQADADATGLPDRIFDVAFCQQGLQFFHDVREGLRELHRLIVAGGRVALSVWTGPDNPGYAPIRSALERHLPNQPEAARFVDAIFALSDAEQLRELLDDAGFRDVRVIRREDTVRCRSAEAWVEAFLAAAPITSTGALDERVRREIVSDAAGQFGPYISRDGIRFPIEANIAAALQ